MRIWLATALLASAWLFGLGYFDPVSLVAWMSAIAAAVLLLGGRLSGFQDVGSVAWALLLLLPALWMVPLPYAGMPFFCFAGWPFRCCPFRNPGTRTAVRGSVLASMILLPQALALLFYQTMTARGHELPTYWPDRCPNGCDC